MQGLTTATPNEGVIKGIKQMNINENTTKMMSFIDPTTTKETEVTTTVVKKKKNITRACEVCQRLRRKCTYVFFFCFQFRFSFSLFLQSIVTLFLSI